MRNILIALISFFVIKGISEPVFSIPIVLPVELSSCNCQLPNSPANVITLEDENSCGKDRLYFQSQLQKLDEAYLKNRSDLSEAEFPKECVVYIMRKFMDASKRPSRSYSYCAKAVGAPQRPKKTHCVDESYVNSVYYSYIDVLDCLEISQKDLLPKLFNESGMHINTLGSGMDAGVGQLTASAISSVQQKASFDGHTLVWLDMFKEEIAKSDKASCQRLSRVPGLFDKISESSSGRCALIGVPQNPLKNVLYTAIFYHYMLRSQTGIRYFAGHNFLPKNDSFERYVKADKNSEFGGFFAQYRIKSRLQELGLKEPNMLAMKQMMITLGYNAGMESAFIFLDNYLKYRKSRKLKLQESDFDFQNSDFSIFKRTKDPKAEIKRLKTLSEAKQSPYKFPFPVFLKIAQITGAPGYLTFVAEKLNQLDREMGVGKCTTENFLRY